MQLELQADCFAGVWAKSAFDRATARAGDFEEAIDAAQAVGDDAIQEKATGGSTAESFTHGAASSASGGSAPASTPADADSCDTFSTDP